MQALINPCENSPTIGNLSFHVRVEERTKQLIEWSETAQINRVEMADKSLGIITSSTSYQYASLRQTQPALRTLPDMR